MNHKIHVAYGFHVNCYHSYRGDTNDNLGFGSDIRIIRKILDVLTDFNEKGIPVKGTWDTENFFSLEKILPEYAPDIIEKMKERVKKYGDENIIMGYSNGALGAMNESELTASIELAVTNEQKSGLKDIFGECEMLVRPQEVMFTPSQVSLYNKLGVKGLCLYYSCVPFDAFRTIIPKLPDELAFNPLTYTYKGESITVIPTYSNSDVCDAGCLRAWVKELHLKQEKGEINHDLLLFINMDADAIFWESMNLPVIGNRIANTDGIHGLVEEIADLPYIVFDTPGNYIKTHKALGEIDFTHDTADGNFTGYASWAEKPYNRKIWTAIERSRMMARVTSEKDSLAPSFRERVLLLSTTHFGLATPVLNIQREKKADALKESILKSEITSLSRDKGIRIHNTSSSLLQCLQIQLKDGLSADSLVIKGRELENYAAFSTDENGGAFLMLKFKKLRDTYKITVEKAKEPSYSDYTEKVITNGTELVFDGKGKLCSLYLDGKKISGDGFLESFITYGGKKYRFINTKKENIKGSGEISILRTSGEIHLPDELNPGSFTFDFITTPFTSGVTVLSSVNYPYTAETTSISTENSSLGRFYDMNWLETAPFQLTPEMEGDIKIIKRNFMEDISSYRAQSFPESDEMNKKLDSFNHQLTAGLVGLTDGNYTLLTANSRQFLGSMAHCPMRLDEDKTVHMNLFGTYYGKQRHHFSRAKGEVLDAYTLVAAQGKPLAPSYNGCSEKSLITLYINQGDFDEKAPQVAEALAFADGAVLSCGENENVNIFEGDNVSFRKVQADGITEAKLKNPVMTGFGGNLKEYITKGARGIGHIIIEQIKAR